MMHEIYTPADRLIVAADFKPTNHERRDIEVRNEVRELAHDLRDTGVTLKLNSALRALGNDLIRDMEPFGLGVFADLRLADTPSTQESDSLLLEEVCPKFVTVMCATGIASIRALKDSLPETEVLGVTVLSTQTEDDIKRLYDKSIREMVTRLAHEGIEAGVDGFVAFGDEIEHLRNLTPPWMTINAVNVRPAGVVVRDDDQNPAQSMTLVEAYEAGADRFIVGRPVTKAGDRYQATMDMLDEISAFKFSR